MDIAITGSEAQEIQRFIGDILSADDCSDLNVYERIEKIEEVLLQYPQVEIPVTHLFTEGVYIRQILIPKGTLLTSNYHKFDQVDIMLTGEMSIVSNSGIKKIKAPFVGLSGPGMKRVGYADEDVLWMDVHPTDTTDIDKLESELFTNDYREIAHIIDREDYQQVLLESGIPHDIARAQTENETDQIKINLEVFGVRLSSSIIDGDGIFALGEFSANQFIAPARMNGLRTQTGRYTNHSLIPNAAMVKQEGDNIDLVSLKEIKKDEEITIDYRQALSLSGIECSKGETLCRQ